MSRDPALYRSFRGHTASVNSVHFGPSIQQVEYNSLRRAKSATITAQQLASAGADNVVMIWNIRPSLKAYRYIGHTAAVNVVQFAGSGELLASGSDDSTIRLWTPTV